MNESKHAAQIDVTMDLIREALAMPEGAIIYDIQRHPNRLGVFTFTVLHEDLPEVIEGEALPHVMPTITADYTKRPSIWLTFDWGKPNE